MDASKTPVTITFVKITGEDYTKALDALRDLSLDMPEVCIMDKAIFSELDKSYPIEIGSEFIYSPQMSMMNLDEALLSLFRGVERVAHKKCTEVLSTKVDQLKEHDFFFEWVKTPTQKQINELADEIRETLEPFNVEYKIQTLKP